MLRIGVITLFPDMLKAVSAWGITGRAVERGLLSIDTFDPRARA